MRTIIAARFEPPDLLLVRWSNGTQARLSLTALAQPENSEGVADVAVARWGHAVKLGDDLEIGADRLWLETLGATGHQDARDFLEWRLRNGLSLAGAGAALGLSRRMVAYYSNGEKPVPRSIQLACKGWEVSQAA
jgi:hypothetical protein